MPRKRVRLYPYTISQQALPAATAGTNFYPKGIAASAFQRRWQAGYRGQGITVAILDAGVDANNPNLQGRVIASYNYTNELGPSDHGTHVCGTICAAGWLIGGAREVSVIDIKIVTKDGGSVPNLVKGIRTAVEQGASVINISLGTDKVEAADIQQITAAVDYAWNRGCLCVAASGNDGKGQGEIDQLAYPAGIDRVISVGAAAVDSNLQVSQIAPFSNENAKVAIAACGVGVLSCIPANKYAVYSGTSMATPHVTAACALIIQELKATSKLTGPALAAAATSALYEEVVDAGAPGKDPAFGYGFLRFDPTAGPYLPKGEAIQQGHTFLGYLIRS